MPPGVKRPSSDECAIDIRALLIDNRWMTGFAIRLLRVGLVVLLLGSVVGQLLVPVSATRVARTFPEVEYLVGPYSVAGVLAIVCAQVALFALWRLLSMITGGAIFTRQAMGSVDLIIACGASATVLSAGVMIHLLATHGGGPGIILLLAITLFCGVSFLLLMAVMRGLLEAAITDRTELAEVI